MATEMAQTDPEGIDGIRMTWNAWPRTKVEASKCVIPIAASISPIRPHPDIPTLPYAPLRCKTCSAVLNPFARVDFAALIWICPFCFQRNHFPHHYSGISETNVPGELYPQYTTIQYSLSPPDSNLVSPPVYVFVLDTCMIEEELGYAKSAVQQAIGLLPENAMVGFVSFGTQVQVHELGFSEMSKVYVFRGAKELSKDQVLDQLGLGRRPGGPGFGKGGPAGLPNSGFTRFLLPASDCEYALSSLLDELGTDQWPVPPANRALRCTGVALSVASGLLGACMPVFVRSSRRGNKLLYRSRSRACKARAAIEAGGVVNVTIKPENAVYAANELAQLTDTDSTVYAAQDHVYYIDHASVDDKEHQLINGMEANYVSGYEPLLDFPAFENITAPLIYDDKNFRNDYPFNFWGGSTSNYPSFEQTAPFENLFIDEDIWKSL